MKINKQIYGIVAAVVILASTQFIGCKKDNSTPAPTATFVSVVNNNQATFTTTETGVTTYAWNFGDTASNIIQSTVQNPVHTYKKTGTFQVTLTVSGSGGSLIVNNYLTIKQPPSGITLSSFAGWDTIAVAWKTTDTLGLTDASTLQLLKIKQTNDTLYMYIETSSKISDSTELSVLFDTDNSAKTGYRSYLYLDNAGFETLYQGMAFAGKPFSAYLETPGDSGWNWTTTGVIASGFCVMGHFGPSLVNPSNTAVEFAFIKANMTGWTQNEVTLGIYEDNYGWSEIGVFTSFRGAMKLDAQVNKPLVIPLTN